MNMLRGGRRGSWVCWWGDASVAPLAWQDKQQAAARLQGIRSLGPLLSLATPDADVYQIWCGGSWGKGASWGFKEESPPATKDDLQARETLMRHVLLQGIC